MITVHNTIFVKLMVRNSEEDFCGGVGFPVVTNHCGGKVVIL